MNKPIHFVEVAFTAFLVAYSAQAASPEQAALVESILDQQKNTQDAFQALNARFEQLYRTTKDIENRMMWLRFPQSEDDREEGYVTGKALEVIKGYERVKTSQVQALSRSLLSTAVMLQGELDSGRLLGARVSETHELYNGPSLAPKKADRGGIGTFGTATREVCYFDPSAGTSDGIDLFLNIHYMNTSCIIAPETMRLVSDPVEALNEKIELLTGSRLTQEQIDQVDPFMQLDFSRSPQLEVIVMGYLEFKNDFSGNLMAQIMRYHADRGTQIRLIVPDQPIPGTSFVHGPDRLLLNSLAAYSPNIRIQKFRLTSRNPDLLSIGSFIEHSYHAKALVALSKEPGKSGVIVGGRNIKDTFYLQSPPRFPRHPEMVQYGKDPEPYALFHDLEISMRGREVAEQVGSQILSFWHRDTNGPRLRRMSEHVPALPADAALREALRAKVKGASFVRFFYSAPYVDGHSLVKTYVDFIHSAKKKLRIVSPYVRPESEISNALRAAALRGVDIDFVTDLSFVGDNSPSFTGDVNKDFFNGLTQKNKKDIADNKDATRVIGKIRVYSWESRGIGAARPADHKMPSILHAKAMLADDDLLYVGSANFDHRSFLHDTENGFLATGEVIPQFKKLFDETYIPKSQEMETKQKTGFISKLLIPLLSLLKVD